MCIIEGKKGIIITDNEACHTVHKSVDEKYEIDVVKISADPNVISMNPDATGKVSIKALQTASYIELELGEWVRRFGSRIENNYDILLKSIKQIGLNPSDFPRLRK